MESCDWRQGLHFDEFENEPGIEVPGQKNRNGCGVSTDGNGIRMLEDMENARCLSLELYFPQPAEGAAASGKNLS